jgi:predicted enzyme related to lactoylglutathione lyase
MALLSVRYAAFNAMNPRKLAEFYAGLLDGAVREHDDGIIEVTGGDGDLGLHFQQANEPARQTGWVHLDMEAEDPDAAIQAVVAAGGSLVERRGDDTFSWTVMADPEGNPFCF